MEITINKNYTFPTLKIEGDSNDRVPFPILLKIEEDDKYQNSIALNREGIKELIVELTKLL